MEEIFYPVDDMYFGHILGKNRSTYTIATHEVLFQGFDTD